MDPMSSQSCDCVQGTDKFHWVITKNHRKQADGVMKTLSHTGHLTKPHTASNTNQVRLSRVHDERRLDCKTNMEV